MVGVPEGVIVMLTSLVTVQVGEVVACIEISSKPKSLPLDKLFKLYIAMVAVVFEPEFQVYETEFQTQVPAGIVNGLALGPVKLLPLILTCS